MDDLMTAEEVARYLRVTKKTIYRLLAQRSIPATRIGSLWRFDVASIRKWLRHNSLRPRETISSARSSGRS